MKKTLKERKFGLKTLFFILGVFILFTGIIIAWVSSFSIPDFRDFEDRKIVNSTKIYDKTGKVLLYDIHQDVKRTDIPFEKMGPNIKNATIAIEDSDFYNHKGIRITSIIRAILSNLFSVNGNVQGGSTITQQLVKNSLLTQKKTYTRKIKEWVLAIEVERALPKDKILEYYLNENPYGGNIYGIQEAARTYFGKEPENLTIAESAYLAAIPQSPTVLSPYGKNLNKLEDRKNLVLSRMRELKIITDEQYETARSEKVTFLPHSNTSIKAPHFVFFIKEYLEKKYGEEVAEKGGLNVITTLDYELQQKAEQIVKEGAIQNEKDWNGKNAALVAIDPKTGQILAMVGSRDYFDKNIDGNFNVSTARRQPGSSFKPFIYAAAFNAGFTPNTVLFDLRTEFSTTCSAYGSPLGGRPESSCYHPDNYDGKFRGPLTLREALGQSINIPAIKLFYLVGTQNAINLAENMGISSLTGPSRYGLTLVIGGGEVSLLDITSAYGVFANSGKRNPYTGIIKIEDMEGKIVEEYIQNENEVLPKNTALIISDILSDNVARTPTFGANSVLNIAGKEVAVKTGTTNNNKDAWTVGYTPTISVGVWAGNNDNKAMKKGGSAVAGPIWNKFMNEALKILPDEKFEKPNLNYDLNLKPVLRGVWQGNESFLVDKISGRLATENTPPEAIMEKVVTNVHSILHWIDRNDIKGPPPSNPSSDSQYEHWEIPIQNWWQQNKGRYSIVTWNQKPTTEDNIHGGGYNPIISIREPNNITVYKPDQKIFLKFTSSGAFPLKRVDVFINEIFMGSLSYPFDFSFIPADLENLRETNEIKMVSYDSAFNHQETSTTFKVQQ